MSIKDRFPFNKLKKKKLPSAKAVYAGPEQMGRPRMSKVYAGPERMGRPDPDGGMAEVYAGPEEMGCDLSDPEPLACVYAGPEMPDPPPEPMKPAYAGPEPPASPMMFVYAGPAYFAGKSGGIPAMPVPVSDPDPAVFRCPVCGHPAAEGAEFCSECGAELPKKERI